jgi:hypothetical protein
MRPTGFTLFAHLHKNVSLRFVTKCSEKSKDLEWELLGLPEVPLVKATHADHLQKIILHLNAYVSAEKQQSRYFKWPWNSSPRFYHFCFHLKSLWKGDGLLQFLLDHKENESTLVCSQCM